jgi:HlyD family secretion protein
MSFQTLIQTAVRRAKRKPILFGLVGVGVIAPVAALITRPAPPTLASTFYEIKRGDFLISVVEGGTLEAVNEVSIRNEVEGIARIIYIVPEGTYVKKGDLLVELDSSATQDNVNQQQINVEKAQFAVIQAEQQLEIQKSSVDSTVQAAKLRMEFAESDLEKYVKGEALQAQRNAQIEITNVLQNLRLAEDRLRWSEKLHKQGFETKSNLDKDRLAVSQGALTLEKAEKALWMLMTFDQPKSKRSLEATLQEAKENLARATLQGERLVAQYRADLETQKSTLELSQKKLQRDLKQLEATKIFAPQDGLVVYPSGYRFSSESMIEEGAIVRNRQELIKLPDVSEMKLQIKIHESHINQVHLDQEAFVVLDSMPDQRFQGVVNKVGVVPDSQSRWGNPNLKVYATEILVTDKLPDVKPGVSARAEIIITNLHNVLTVPIQAVTTRKGQQVVFSESAPHRPARVGIGMYNTKFIEITSGLKEGDRVLLAPRFDTEEKDLGGAIIAEGESLPSGGTNKTARSSARTKSLAARGSQGKSKPIVGASPGGRGSGSKVTADKADGGKVSQSQSDTTFPVKQSVSFVEHVIGGSSNQLSLLKQFDKNGDGQLDDNERAAMRNQFNREVSRSTPPADNSTK